MISLRFSTNHRRRSGRKRPFTGLARGEGMTTQTLIEHSPRPESTSSVLKRVLIVDGDPSARQILTEFLRSDPAPIEPVVVESMDAALRALRSDEKIDFLLTDIRPPEIDGLELLVAARQLRPGLRMAAMADSPSEETRRAAFESGALQLLVRPLDVEDLLASLLNDRPGLLSYLEGDLDLVDVCLLSAACQTDGGVRIHGSAGEGVVIHRGTTVLYAATGAFSGLEAFQSLLELSSWSFGPRRAGRVFSPSTPGRSEAPRPASARGGWRPRRSSPGRISASRSPARPGPRRGKAPRTISRS
jgi:CheY-like chemotaxis protein